MLRTTIKTKSFIEIIPFTLSASGQMGLSHYRQTMSSKNNEITAD